MIVLVLAALAADGPPEGWQPVEAPPPVEAPIAVDDTPEEIVIVGEIVVADRRAAVVRAFEGLGWRRLRDRDGTVVLRGPEAWMGKAWLAPTGDLRFTAPVVALLATTGGPW